MSRLLLLGAAAAACTHAGSVGAPGQAPCRRLTPEIRAQMGAADEATRARYAGALARQQLTPLALPSRQVRGWPDEGAPQGGPQHPPGTTFEEDGKAWVAGPFVSVPNGQLPGAYLELVEDAAGDVYQLERAPHVVSSASVVLCGCGPAGSGVVPHLEQVIYELPAGAASGAW